MIQNTKYKIQNTKIKGFTLVEALVLLFVFSVITVTFYNIISMETRYIIASKNRLNAVAIANEKMEIIRNLEYDDVGIQGGICEGIISQDEDVIRDDRTYHVYTLAKYEDDPYDGTLGGSPDDEAYKDYKTVKVKVSWGDGGDDSGVVSLTSNFTPPGLEVADSGEGILSINVFSDQAGGAEVPQATIHIVNTDEGIDQTIQTDDSGNVMLVGAKESIQEYQLTVSKSGYETVNTFPSYPDTSYNPIDVHASVIGGTLNVTNIIQNKLADLKIITKDYLGNSVSDINFDLSGGRKLGTEVNLPYDPVYSLDVTDESTDSGGEKEFNSISPGQYTFKLASTETDYSLIGIDNPSPFSLASEESLEVNVKVADKNETSLLIIVEDNSDDSRISGASVRIKSDSLSYDETVETGDDGMAFFPTNETTPVLAGTYDLIIEKTGFQNIADSIEITENSLSEETAKMMTT